MKALVTGAAGFVGSNISRRLLKDGWDVTGVDSFTDYYDPALKHGNIESFDSTQWTFVDDDLLNMDLNALLRDVDVVFHQAGQPGVRKSWGAEFTEYTRANVELTQALLEAARDSSISRFVYASSSSVYGEAERYPTVETDRPAPRSPYGVTKLAAEHLCSLYAANFGVPTTSLRYFTVYGPGQRPDMAFTRFVRAAVLDEQIDIYGSGNQVRDFTFIDDVVEANARAAIADVAPGTVVNISGGSHISVNSALKLLDAMNGRPIRRRHLDSIAGDVFQTGGDNSLARTLLEWEPTVTVEEGLQRHLEWATRTFTGLASMEPAA